MEEKIKKIKWLLSECGFMSATHITNEALKLNCVEAEIKQIFDALNQDVDIKKVQYTNRFIAKYCVKDLYCYKPKVKRVKV